MAENEFEMIPDEMKEIINTIALADSVKRTIQEKEIDGVEMTKTDKANIIGYLCCDKGPEINRALGYIMMNAIFASDDLDAVVTAFDVNCFVVHASALSP